MPLVDHGLFRKLCHEHLPSPKSVTVRNFQERRLIGTVLYTTMTGQSFKGFELENVTFLGPLEGSDFSGARMHRMKIYDFFGMEQMYSTTNYRQRDLSTLLFSGLAGFGKGNFTKWDFADCDVAYFLDCDLTGARFENSIFLRTKATRISAPPTGNPLHLRLFYSMVRLADIGFDGCIVTESQLQETANWKRKDLRGMHLKDMNLDGWDFSGMNMDRADLSGSSLKGTKFAGANVFGLTLKGCKGLTVSQLLESKTHVSRTRQDILRAYYWYVDFADRTEEEAELQESMRRMHSKDGR